MHEERLQSSDQTAIRNFLRVGGLAAVALGLVFTIIGIASFFSAFGGSEPPRFFWCAFLGMPLMFVGSVMCGLGFLGAVQRYVAGESAPVAKDVVNYMGENTSPGIKAAAKSVTEGVLEARREQA
jgi:hypothetical protein